MASLAAGAAALLSTTFATLRQGRLLDAATAACAARAAEADGFLAREPALDDLLAAERLAADERYGAVLHAETAGETLATATDLASQFDAQELAVRLVSLDLDLPRFGASEILATLRWEVAASQDTPSGVDDPVARWSPPVLLLRGDRSATRLGNGARWTAADRAATDLQARAPALRRVARKDAERDHLEQQRLAVERWREASRAESLAVQRRLPELFRRLDLSAEGRAALRPGPAGLMVAESP